MENFVTRSKYVSETISIIVDFADVLPAGQTIQGTPVVSVALDTGYDPTPANILYLGVFVRNGTIVEQRFRLGVPGVIYQITWYVVAINGEEFQKTTFLAILPNVGSVAPNYITAYETSCLYPYDFSEYMQSNVAWTHFFQGYTSPPEWISSQIYLDEIQIIGTFVSYTYGPETITSSISWSGGSVGGTMVTYTYGPEEMKSNIAWISCSIRGSFISYSSPHEDMKSIISWQSASIS